MLTFDCEKTENRYKKIVSEFLLHICHILTRKFRLCFQIANSMLETENKKKNLPHIYNLNMDPQLTGHIFYFFESTPIMVGKAVNNAGGSIQLKGPR